MLLACSTCRRAFPIGNLPPGTAVSCPCGAPNVVTRPPPRQRRMANCGNCGGKLAEGAAACDYCQARVTRAEEGFGDPCPFCFVPLVQGARYCNGCGQELRPLAMRVGSSSESCARCKAPMDRMHQEEEYLRCTACASVWIARAALQRFLAAAEARGATQEEFEERRRKVNARVPGTPVEPARGPRAQSPLRCLECAGTMGTLEFSGYSGVLVHECRTHGWWLDAGELEALANFVRTGGHVAARKRYRARMRMRRSRARYRHRLRGEGGLTLFDVIEGLGELIDD